MDGQTQYIPRIPPNDTEAEQAVLSSMLYDREAISAACETLRGEDFYRPDNQAIFETMTELFARSVPVDVVTLGDKLTEKGLLEQTGGRERIIELAAAYYTSANIRQYTRIVAEKALLRRLIKAANEISAAGYDAREEVEIILEHAEKSIFDIVQRRNVSDFAHISAVLTDALVRLEELYQSKGHITGVETGFVDFDKRTAGLQPADLILIGSRPSMGKTAFMLNIAQHASVRNAVPTAIFSLEMSKEQLINRMLCCEANLDAQRLRTGELSDTDWEKISNSVAPLSNAPLYIDDTPGISVAEMRAKCRRLKIEKNLGLVVIDYLQLMSGSSSRAESRQLEISEISRSLKALAKELHVPVLTAAQLSRAVEARKDHRPMLSDLRESGAIEQDADVVAFLYRDEYYNPETLKKNHAEVIIAKQRNGPTGTVELTYLGQYTKFANMYRDL
ncbi:MAG: replicative DNA helicase [Clostridiales bacterium]|jgi:replicative DNA helicase|nr:replicative DNA helicase [Clostridiales bacterium]